jgi:2'-5' RNA ligase
VRVLTGLPLPEDTAAAVERWTADWRRRFPRVGWVAAPLLHISLHFFGELSEEQVRRLSDDLADMGATAVKARTGGVGRFPPGRGVPPRVIYLALERGAEEVAALQARYVARIAALGHGAEARPFVPHLTLARVKRPERGLEQLAGGPALDFTFDRLVLFQSILRPQGPEYRPLETAVLGAAS